MMAGINWAWLGEAVRGVMVERIHQGWLLIYSSNFPISFSHPTFWEEILIRLPVVETRDGKKYTELEAQSETMQVLNRRFKKLHAASIHVNLIGLAATVGYGVLLGNNLG